MLNKLQLLCVTKIRLDKAIAEHLEDMSRSKIQSLIKAGNVAVDGVIVNQISHQLIGEKQITITQQDVQKIATEAQQMPIQILFEDEHILVVNKAAGVVVHPAHSHYSGTLINGLLWHCGDSLSGINGELRPGIVHRLDKNTSGAIIIAKSDVAHVALAKQFQKRTIIKKYIAFCIGIPKRQIDSIRTLITRDKKRPTAMAVHDFHGKEAVTHYRVSEVFGSIASKIECQIETGRTHQIRVHMSHIKVPIIGDKTYMNRNIETLPNIIKDFPRQALHASFIQFLHPISKETVSLTAAMPDDLLNLENDLRNMTTTS